MSRVLQVLLIALLAALAASALGIKKRQNATVLTTTSGGSITESNGNVLTITTNGFIQENGVDIPGSGGSSAVTYINGVIYGQDASSGGWYTWDGSNWNYYGPNLPNSTIILTTTSGGSITENSGVVLTITSGGAIQENGVDIPGGEGSSGTAYINGVVYGRDASSGNWYSWNGSTWTYVGPNLPSSGTGQFVAANGQIEDPSGDYWAARGINVYDFMMSDVCPTSDCTPMLSLFPGLNYIRLACFSYQDPSYYQQFIEAVTSKGIVVEIEDHTNNAGNSGGSAGTIYTGTQLQDELNWYSALASAYSSNPYVWFGTDNEPSEDPSAYALSTWQQQTYNAIRSTGNNNPIMIELNGGTTPESYGQGYNPQVYITMTNVILDMHVYGWVFNGEQVYGGSSSADIAYIQSQIAANVQAAQYLLPGAWGKIPIIVGEYGPSTNAEYDDANGFDVLPAVQNSVDAGVVSGAVAWVWASGGPQFDVLTDGNGNLTPYGQEVAAWINA